MSTLFLNVFGFFPAESGPDLTLDTLLIFSRDRAGARHLAQSNRDGGRYRLTTLE